MRGWSRRQVLAAGGVAAVGAVGAVGALAGCSDGGSDDEVDRSNGSSGGSPTGGGPGQPADFDPADWDSVRAQFPLDPDLRHFAAFVLASHPRPVAEAIERHREGLDRDAEGYLLAEEQASELGVREAASRYLGGEPDQVALTDSTTMGLGLLYGGLRLGAGDEVLTTEHDFYSTHEALRLRSERTGATVRRARLYDDPATADAGEMAERLLAAVTPATSVVAITWVHSSTGVKLPVADIAAGLRDLPGRDEPVLLCVDGVHGLGADAATPGDLGADFLVSGTHKWLFGPRGTGIVWGTPEAWNRLDPIVPPFEPTSLTAWISGVAAPRTQPGLWATPGGYHSFEHRWALGAAFDFHRTIGADVVAERIATQATQLKEGLAAIDGVTVHTPLDPAISAGVVCATVGSSNPVDVVAGLRADGIVASVTPYREQYVRFGPGIVTTPDDVDALLESVATLA